MLVALMDQKEERQTELKERLEELEKKKDQETDNYWLIQYQKLLDSKPKVVHRFGTNNSLWGPFFSLGTVGSRTANRSGSQERSVQGWRRGLHASFCFEKGHFQAGLFYDRQAIVRNGRAQCLHQVAHSSRIRRGVECQSWRCHAFRSPGY